MTVINTGTPGQICSAVAVLEEVKVGIPIHVSGGLTTQAQVTAVELRERMSSNICRCRTIPTSSFWVDHAIRMKEGD
jgi:aerobic-type carbon monoxide dehydrogenase small subunit (CoxS/CutS family)